MAEQPEIKIQVAPNVKAITSVNYLARQKEVHGEKIWVYDNIRAIIYGALKSGSIGMEISNNLVQSRYTNHIWCAQGDVRNPCVYSGLIDFNALILSHGMTWLDWFEDCPYNKMKKMIDVNLFGTANIIQAFVRATLMNNERKRIIVIGSMAHRSVLNGSAVYCASKAGVAMLTRCLAWELAPKGFDVFCIHPSNTKGTPMTKETIEGLERYRGLTRPEAESYWNDSPIRSHMLQTDDVAGLIQFLLQPGSEWLAGAQLEMGGGQR